jgi:hypothetical protein
MTPFYMASSPGFLSILFLFVFSLFCFHFVVFDLVFVWLSLFSSLFVIFEQLLRHLHSGSSPLAICLVCLWCRSFDRHFVVSLCYMFCMVYLFCFRLQLCWLANKLSVCALLCSSPLSLHVDVLVFILILCLFCLFYVSLFCLFLQFRICVCGLGTMLCQYLRICVTAAFYVVRWIPCYGFLSVA